MKAGYLFLKIYGISNFTWERKKLGQMWRSWWPSQIRYNLVILRMFEIQAGPDWIYILLAGFLTPPPPLPPPTSQPFLYFSPKMPQAILHIFHMSGTSFAEKWEIWNRQHKELDLSELLSVAISRTQVLKLNYKQTNKGPTSHQPSAVFLTVGRCSAFLQLNKFTAIQTRELLTCRLCRTVIRPGTPQHQGKHDQGRK